MNFLAHSIAASEYTLAFSPNREARYIARVTQFTDTLNVHNSKKRRTQFHYHRNKVMRKCFSDRSTGTKKKVH
jgi:hypothetical protein